jgi:hypothetical protein
MTRLNLILLPSMLVLALPSWGAGGAKTPGRPLNLSVPRDVVQTPRDPQVDETVERNLRAPVPPRGPHASHPAALPYGAGYEHRHPEGGEPGGWAGSGTAPAAGGNAGGRGR